MATGRREIPFRLTAENRTQAAFRSLRRDVNQINTLSRQFAGVFGTAFGAAGLAQLGSGLREILSDVDALAKGARELNIELGQLESIRFAGDLLGIDERQVDRVLARLRRVQGQAIVGTEGSSVDLNQAAFEALGLSVDNLRRQDPSALLDAVVRGLAQVTDETERAAIANQLLGQRLGGTILRFAELGPEAFAGLRREQEGFSGLTEESAGRVEELNDAIARLNAANLGRIQEQLTNLLPEAGTIRAFGQALSQGLRNVEFDPLAFFASPGGEVARVFGQIFGTAEVAIERAAEPITDITNGLTDATQQAIEFAGEIPNITSNFLDARREAERLKEEQRAAREEQRRAIQETSQLQSAAQTLLGAQTQRPRTGQAAVGTERDFQSALALAQQTDPNTQILQRILEELSRRQQEQALNRLVELLPRLNNPVFT